MVRPALTLKHHTLMPMPGCLEVVLAHTRDDPPRSKSRSPFRFAWYRAEQGRTVHRFRMGSEADLDFRTHARWSPPGIRILPRPSIRRKFQHQATSCDLRYRTTNEDESRTC